MDGISEKDRELARRFNHWRCAAGHKKAVLARLVGVTRSNITEWESGRGKPSWGAFFRFCDACGITPQIFFSRFPDTEAVALSA